MASLRTKGKDECDLQGCEQILVEPCSWQHFHNSQKAEATQISMNR